jgi:Tol biopolymer transport system component
MKPLWGSRSLASVGLTLALLVVGATAMAAACGGTSTTASNTPSATTSTSAEPSQSATPLPSPTVAGVIAFEKVVETGENFEGENSVTKSNICVVNADGTSLKTLAQAPTRESQPTWSPDGGRIVYVVYGVGMDNLNYAALWVMSGDGSGKRQLTKGSVRGIDPAWSLDGKQIAFSGTGLPGEGKTHFSIYVMNADGSGLRSVRRLAGGKTPQEYQPAWAPDGRILFLRLGDVWSVKLDGSGLAQLTKAGNVARFALSPDGKSIALQTSETVGVAATRGSGAPVTLIEPVSDFMVDPNAAAAWTSDGKALAMASGGPMGSRLYVVNADGSRLSAVPGVDTAAYPAWRPK